MRAQSTVARATYSHDVQPGPGDPTWVGVLPNFNQIPVGSTTPIPFAPYVANVNPALHQYGIKSGALPAGANLDPLVGIVPTGTGVAGVNSNVQFTILDNAQADWNARSAGTSYAENWATYATAADYHAFWNRAGMSGHACPKNPTQGSVWTDAFEVVNTVGHMRTGKAFRMYHGKHNYPDSGVLDNQWFNVLFNGDPTNVSAAFKRKFYVQITIWVDEFIDYYWRRGDDNTVGQAKLFRIDDEQSTNNGEIVVTNQNNWGFVTGYHREDPTGANQPFDRQQITQNFFPNFAQQPAINNASPPSPTTEAQFRQKYGPMNYGMISGTSQASLLHLQANTPDPDALIGGVAWVRGGLTTVEVMADLDTQTCKYWAAPTGSAPRKTVDQVNCLFGSRIMTNGVGWSTFEFTNLIFNVAGSACPGYPISWVDYSELICSSSPINFPGGFTLP